MNWEKAGRVIATIGLIVLLILGAWGIIILAFSAPEFLDNLGARVGGFFGSDPSADSEQATSTPTTLPETLIASAATSSVVSGGSIALSWRSENTAGPRGYLLSYACQQGLSLEAPTASGQWRTVPCNTGFNYTNATVGTTLRANLSGATPRPATITVSAVSLASGTTTARETVSVMVTPRTVAKPASPTAAKPKPAAKKPAVNSYTSYTSYRSNSVGPDLMVRIESAGPGWVRFNIQNVGTKTVPAGWQFTAQIPYDQHQPYQYASPPQMALTPGSGVVSTLTWNAAASQPTYCTQQTPYAQGYGGSQYPNPYCPPSYPSTQSVSVTVDPYNRVTDYNRYNNTANASF